MENIKLEKELSILKNKLIISIFITIVLCIVLGVYTYPELKSVSNIKNELLGKISEYDTYAQKGITDITTFDNLVKDPALKKLLVSEEGKTFFTSQFNNDTSSSYDAFLTEKQKHIDDVKKSGVVDERNNQISKVLPSYTEGYEVEGNMTDLAFVNYVESLLRTFQLRTTSQIGIENLVPVDQTETNVSTQIFYIPLKLDLVGRKADIVEFLYFLQNVGLVGSIDEKNNNSLVFYKDNLVNRTIAGQRRTINYNIYENKLVDIESVEFNSYVDNSASPRPSSQLSPEGFLTFVKNGSEKNDEYSVIVDLKFYVKGLPTYKIEVFVESVIKKYREMTAQVETILGQAKNRKTMLLNGNIVEIIPTLKSIETYLTQLQPKVNKLQDGINKKVNLNTVYKEASELNYELGNLDQYIHSIQLEDNKK
ncbi:MAG: hypothetical protein AB7E37_02060 [Candidatus Altimarinota bacterium]